MPSTNLEGKILELIKERKKMMDGENIFDLKYDKGYIHACAEILDYIRIGDRDTDYDNED